MFGKQEPKVSAMRSFNSRPQSCLQHWLGSVFQKMMVSLLPDLVPGVAPAVFPCRGETPCSQQPGWWTHHPAKGLNERRGECAARWAFGVGRGPTWQGPRWETCTAAARARFGL